VEKERSSSSGTEWSRVRRRRLLQIGGHAGRAEREIGGGGSVLHRGKNGGERERARGAVTTVGSAG
jgi:hypothetical protein